MDNNPSLHALLLLSDSALPLGSFAFSSGLESYLAHQKLKSQTSSSSSSSQTSSRTTTTNLQQIQIQNFETFLSTSLQNLASTALPYVLTAYSHPKRLRRLDNDLDASTVCSVARRASVSQGKALLALWERAFRATVVVVDIDASSMKDEETKELLDVISEFLVSCKGRGNSRGCSDDKSTTTTSATVFDDDDDKEYGCNAHFAPLFGVVCKALGLSEGETAYLFLLNHAKALLSAAVRASVMGPYQSQAFLAGVALRERIKKCIARERDTEVEDAGLTVPPMDLWMGRHELLYSRIFNS